MSVFVVRGRGLPWFYVPAPGATLRKGFEHAFRFFLLDDARKEAARYESWREVMRVSWVVKWRGDSGETYYQGTNLKAFHWTTDRAKSKRFASRAAARKFARYHGEHASVIRLMQVVR